MAAWPFRGSKGDYYTKINASTVETIIVPGFEEKIANIAMIVFANTSATACKVTIKESLAGNTRLVVKVPANNTLSLGTGEDIFLEDRTKGQPWTATCESVDSMEITVCLKADN